MSEVDRIYWSEIEEEAGEQGNPRLGKHLALAHELKIIGLKS